MELVLERCVTIFSPAGVLFVAISVLMISIAANAQTAVRDTSAGRTSDSSRVTIDVVQDTAGRAADTLSSKGDTARSASDSLAALIDTTIRKKDTLAVKKDTLEILTSNASYNTVPGFRVQILTTQTLDKAIRVKAEADSLLPNYNVYIVYDSPYYKVRIGNFRARYEANQAVTYIAGHGFPSAWLVPDNVFRNPVHRSN